MENNMEGVLTTAEKKMKRMNQWYRNKQDIFRVFDYVVFSGKKKKGQTKKIRLGYGS